MLTASPRRLVDYRRWTRVPALGDYELAHGSLSCVPRADDFRR